MAIEGFDQILKVATYSDLPESASTLQLARTRDTKITYEFDGTMWLPLNRTSIKKSSVIVNGKTTGAVPIYTLEQSNMSFYPTQIIIRAVNISGATLKPTLSVGTNASSYDNIASGSLLNSITSLLGITSQPQNVSTSPALSGGAVIYANVSIGALATNYTFKVDIIGYYENN
jgi:hypothetical protein